ncbi:uncharacterized protein LOC143358145 [Halictus rubicundus]|uniref:uncharacterized protein LOC143358145 n=1 Tax=Halictus rubicundus TaxID=77578 RepID=UPI0040372AB9
MSMVKRGPSSPIGQDRSASRVRALRSSIAMRVLRDGNQYRGSARPVPIVQPPILVKRFRRCTRRYARTVSLRIRFEHRVGRSGGPQNVPEEIANVTGGFQRYKLRPNERKKYPARFWGADSDEDCRKRRGNDRDCGQRHPCPRSER